MPGLFRRRLFIPGRRSRRMSGTKFTAAVLAAVFVFLLIFAAVVSGRLRPILIETASVAAVDDVTQTVNEEIRKVLSKGDVSYTDLILLEKTTDGRVTALVTNMSKVNSLQAEITNAVIRSLANGTETIVRIPFGSLTGISLLSGVGPYIPVKIASVTSVEAEFNNNFISAGINQTKHQLMLDVDVCLTIFVPGATTTVNTVCEVVVAETIIVGEVPQSFADIMDGYSPSS